MKVGRYEGQILDVEPISARALIESGRGEDPFAIKSEPETEPEAVCVPVKKSVNKR